MISDYFEAMCYRSSTESVTKGIEALLEAPGILAAGLSLVSLSTLQARADLETEAGKTAHHDSAQEGASFRKVDDGATPLLPAS